jgi:hypothetical protein
MGSSLNVVAYCASVIAAKQLMEAIDRLTGLTNAPFESRGEEVYDWDNTAG